MWSVIGYEIGRDLILPRLRSVPEGSFTYYLIDDLNSLSWERQAGLRGAYMVRNNQRKCTETFAKPDVTFFKIGE